MERVITYNFGENFIDNLAGFLVKNFSKESYDFSRIVCVFGGKRPAKFLRRALSRKTKRAFYPPRMFSIDEFIEYIVGRARPVKRIGELDAAYYIYKLTGDCAPSLLKRRSSFNEFLPWGREIASFIEQLDLEDIENQSLRHIEKSAAIGYDVPQSINVLLQHLVKIRSKYHAVLSQKNIYSRGRMYLTAASCVSQRSFDEFDAILFCNLFYLHATEARVMHQIHQKKKGIFIFQGSASDWSVLQRNAQKLKIPIASVKEEVPQYEISLYQGFDIHSQVCLVRKILDSNLKSKDNTVIIMPRSQTLVPLLTEISPLVKEVNVSLGYPLKSSSLYVLFDALLRLQESRKDGKYYTKDYLDFLKHPIIKNLKIGILPAATRVLVHKIEELLGGSEETSIGGSLFLSLDEIEQEEKIYLRTTQTLLHMDIQVSTDQCRCLLKELHALLLYPWEGIGSFSEFSDNLIHLLRELLDKSMLMRFPFSSKVVEKIYDIGEELKTAVFSKERFSTSQMWEIFQQRLEAAVISFVGSPLRGMQVLGLFEARSLNFDNVIVIDANESVLPQLKIYEPLIPREVMLQLGLNRLEKEEEIQRYQFMRLLSGAKKVYLVYEENQDKEKSRFIEELFWARQKRENKLHIASIPKASFSVKVTSPRVSPRKTPQLVEFLKKESYSASRLNTYIKCPLQFYYKYILGLKEREDLLKDPEASHLGIFIHGLLEDTFSKFKGKKPVIDDSFKKYFFKVMKEKFARQISPRMKSDAFLLEKIIAKRVNKFLDHEAERKVAKIICLESKRTGTLILDNEPVKFKYTVDRIDECEDGSLQIIDYKIGSVDFVPKRLAGLQAMELNRQGIKENIKSFQLPLYLHFVSEEFPRVKVNAQLYSIRTLERKAFIPEADYRHKERIMEICMQALKFIFTEIVNPNVPFAADIEERKCQFCDFRALCR